MRGTSGTVMKRGKTWTFVLDLPRGEDGKRRRKWQGGFATRKQAQSALAKALSLVADGGDPFPEKRTLSEYALRWLDAQENGTELRPLTLQRYRVLLRDHVLPEIGTVDIRRVKPVHVRHVMDAMRKRGRAARTIQQARAVLSSLLSQAVEDELITVNPARAVKPPRAEQEKRPDDAIPSPQQLAALIATARGTSWEIPILLAATTGARRSEVLGLRWEDVDLAEGRVTIAQTLQRPARSGEGYQFARPKSEASQRSLLLGGAVTERLRAHRKEQMQRRLALAGEWQETGLVCDRGDGAPLDPDAMTKAFRRLASRAGLSPQTRLHDVRHGVATMMLGQGTHMAITSAILGHSSPAFTMRTYQHANDSMIEQATTAIEDALGL